MQHVMMIKVGFQSCARNAGKHKAKHLHSSLTSRLKRSWRKGDSKTTSRDQVSKQVDPDARLIETTLSINSENNQYI